MNLYEIDKGIERILENGFNGEVDEETGELIEYGTHDLDELLMERKDKIEAICLYIKNQEALAADIKTEEETLSERRKAKEAKIERLKEYLATSMTAAGEDKFETAKTAVSFRKSKAVVIDNEDIVPIEYKKEKITVTPDKTAIKKAIESGAEIAGARIEERRKVAIK